MVQRVGVTVARGVVSREEELVNPAVLVRGEHHVVEDGTDGGVAEGLDGQDGEGLLDLQPELLDAEQEEGDGHD